MDKKNLIENDEIELFTYVKVLWHRKGLIGVCSVILIIYAFFYIKSMPKLYESISKWTPGKVQSSMSGHLSGFAALTGMNLKSGEDNYEMMYTELLKSPILLDSVINEEWSTVDGKMNLMSFLQIDTINMVVEEEYLSKEQLLRERLYKFFTGVVTYKKQGAYLSLEVLTTDPLLSYNINKSLIQHIKRYTETDKSKKSNRNRSFIEERFEDFQSSLRSAETSLKNFQEIHRAVTTPVLILEQQRLIREVEIYNQLVIEFRKQLELARVEEVKRIPDFVILQEPTISRSATKPNKKILFIASFGLSIIISCFIAFCVEWWNNHNTYLKKELRKRK